MSRTEKLLQRFLSIPSDFTWEELAKLLAHFGYAELKKGKTAGSRRKFADSKNNIINFHEPHPSNILKKYAIKQAIADLIEKEHIQNE